MPKGNPHSINGTPIAKEFDSARVCPDVNLKKMNQNAQLPAVQNGAWRLRIPMPLWNWAIVSALVLVVYWRVLSKLVETWLEIPDYSHGILIPFFAAYLVWAKRKSLQKVALAPTWTGIAIVAFALGLLILGEFGAELFVSRISIIVLCAGLVLGFGGWQLLKELRFTLGILLLAVPIPAIVFNQIALPLQQVASTLSTALLHRMSVPALRLGNIIELPSIRLEVADACSGIRSLMSLFTLAIFFGYFFEKTFQRRVVLAVASVPIAIAANAIRIFGTGMCVQYWDAQRAMGFFHEFSGWVMFVVSLFCLSIVHLFMTLIPVRRGGAA
jgi:exosortase